MTTNSSVLGGVERPSSGALVTLSFGIVVAMWSVGYVGRLPAVMLPSPVLLIVLLACMTAGGLVAGRRTGRGFGFGAAVGALVGTVNLLVLGSLLTGDQPNRLLPSAAVWVLGSIAVTAALVGLGASFGARSPAERPTDWPALLVRIAVLATLLLVAVGGLVTSHEAGLAVVDWPNSYGYNMFLYPLARMTGGIYYEHAHRLFGALVGLTTVVTAAMLQRYEHRRWVRVLAWVAVGMVVVQGILGGLRVTGEFTWSDDPADTRPSAPLAVVHGVFGQVFLATLVGLAVFTSAAWRRGRDTLWRRPAPADRALGIVLCAVLVAQIALGALQRHTASLLLLHVVLACVVAPLALAVGLRGWALYADDPQSRRTGIALMVVTGVQVLLGVGAYIATGAGGVGPESRVLDITLATAHQWCGAVLLGLAVTATLWNFRPLRAHLASAGSAGA